MSMGDVTGGPKGDPRTRFTPEGGESSPCSSSAPGNRDSLLLVPENGSDEGYESGRDVAVLRIYVGHLLRVRR
jgi:hypothetical protein